MEYQVVLEYDPATRHYTATVPGIPSIIVDAKSQRGALKLAREAIAFYLEEMDAAGLKAPSLRAKVVTVDV